MPSTAHMTGADAARAESARRVARTGVTAAAYAALTLVALLFLGSLAWGPVQFRVSEALCVLALFSPDAVWGLSLGCAIANLANIALSGTGMLGMLDVVFGTLATAVGAALTWRLRRRPLLALAGPVVANALIVPAYLPLMLQGIGFYTIPFTSIALDGAYPAMYLFGLVATGVGEAAVMYACGLPLARALARTPLPRWLGADDEARALLSLGVDKKAAAPDAAATDAAAPDAAAPSEQGRP